MATDDGLLIASGYNAHARIVDTHFRRQEVSAKLFPPLVPTRTPFTVPRQLAGLFTVRV